MIESNPKQKGIGKSKTGKPKVKQSVYTRSKSKRSSKGEAQQNPLSYIGSEYIGYQL